MRPRGLRKYQHTEENDTGTVMKRVFRPHASTEALSLTDSQREQFPGGSMGTQGGGLSSMEPDSHYAEGPVSLAVPLTLTPKAAQPSARTVPPTPSAPVTRKLRTQ